MVVTKKSKFFFKYEKIIPLRKNYKLHPKHFQLQKKIYLKTED